MARERTGILRTAAKRIGVPFATYMRQLSAGLKWCTKGKHWQPRSVFWRNLGLNSGLDTSCSECRVVKERKSLKGRPGRNRIDLASKTFGRWTVIGYAGVGTSRWLCRCSCPEATERAVAAHTLRSGASLSCGCLSRELASRRASGNITHGESGGGRHTAEYKTWAGMIKRCESPHCHGYERYGGRGIRVCDRWRRGEGSVSGYECFLADMGRKPTPKHTIDRYPNNDGDYEPTNCRWATDDQQRSNQRKRKKRHG